MRKSKIKQISLAVCLALMPYSSFAAGLGKLNVSSGLGEPLKAEVELLSVSPDELSTLVAAIASEEAYAAQGITRLGIHNSIKVELTKNADGSPVLKLHSSQPISDPYLDMLIQVDWASGRLQREYTVLLDPPGYKQTVDQTPASPIKPPSVVVPITNEQVSSEAPSGVSKGKKSKKASVPVDTAPLERQESADEQKLTTKRGDTLISIAKKMQVEGVGLDQMLVGLYESNKEAFTSNNMNRLKVGQIIKVPTKESLMSVGSQQAKQSVKVHSENWNAYRNSLAGAVATAPLVAESEHKQVSSGKIATAEDKATPVKTGPQDVVKLSAGEKDLAKGGKESGKAADAKLIALQEEAIAREKTLKETQVRAAALEKQIQDMQQLLALKSQTMLDLQKNAEMAAKAPKADEKTEVVAQAKAPEIIKPEVAKVETPEKAEIKPVVDSAAKPAPEVKKQVAKAPPPQPPAEVGMFDSLLNFVDLTILGGASGVALLGAAWMFLRNKRRKDLDSFERGILTSGGLRANTVFGNTTGSTSSADTSFLTDFAQSANGSMIDANDVDPIAEAEVYMAYGRDAQAEEILKDAISKEPKRYELHLKLLEMYAGQRDVSAFEAVAGELYTTLGAEDPTWIKVAEMGATIEPENPLYNVTKSAGSAAPVAGATLDASDFADVEVSTDDSLDFSLDDGLVAANNQPDALNVSVMDMQEFSASPSTESDLSFDLGSDELESEPVALAKETDLEFPSFKQPLEASVSDDLSAKADAESVIDFDLDSLGGDFSEAASSATSEVSLTDAGSVAESELPVESTGDRVMDFDLGDFNMSAETVAPIEPINDLPADDLPAFDFTSAVSDEVSASKLDSSAFDIDSNVTDDFEFSLPSEQTNDVALKETADAVASAIHEVSFDFGTNAEEVVEPSLSIEPNDTDAATTFDFSLNELPKTDEPVVMASTDNLLVEEEQARSQGSTGNTSESESASEELEANEFDLSSISLDLGDDLHDVAMESTSVELGSPDVASPEPQDVEIKLDLVAAYIDMDDTEGARELLEEVIKEGGPQQQVRAQQLLASLA